jgi:hypothetical protein
MDDSQQQEEGPAHLQSKGCGPGKKKAEANLGDPILLNARVNQRHAGEALAQREAPEAGAGLRDGAKRPTSWRIVSLL